MTRPETTANRAGRRCTPRPSAAKRAFDGLLAPRLRRPEQGARRDQRADRREQRQRGDQGDRDRDGERRAHLLEEAERRQDQREERDDDRAGRRGDRLADPADRVDHGLLGLVAGPQPFAVAEHQEQEVVGADAEQHDDQQRRDRAVRLEAEELGGVGDQRVGDRRTPSRSGGSAAAPRRIGDRKMISSVIRMIAKVPTNVSALARLDESCWSRPCAAEPPSLASSCVPLVSCLGVVAQRLRGVELFRLTGVLGVHLDQAQRVPAVLRRRAGDDLLHLVDLLRAELGGDPRASSLGRPAVSLPPSERW